MNAESYENWKNVYREFLKSGESKETYCQTKGLALRWFERQCRKAETYEWRRPLEEQKPPEKQKELFVELISEETESERQKSDTVALKLTYREVTFELKCGFGETTFMRALQAVREAL